MSLVTLAMWRLQVLSSPDKDSKESEEQTLFTSDSCMAHCLSPMGLWNKQKNHGMDEVQEIVTLDPSVIILSGLGWVDIMDIADDFIKRISRTRIMDCNASILIESLPLKIHNHYSQLRSGYIQTQ